ncbi:MAG: hypothetical protein F4Z00_12375 [Acidimicrobiaceae bacterium]|nr:hypothetical protein [Acidimicrobiaceae bacterium]MXY09248.1 hypothetical protein [Acidimicrobiaceae bacterium]MXZ66324.1 hypothetical protein [Acidimicrobiaceae bacterium]MYF32319.1 hypothetical protein [Acidimicrobiaceae bacterium]MYG77521.1 hypothetical protein [Acidimicrobiaceae bacterium]
MACVPGLEILRDLQERHAARILSVLLGMEAIPRDVPGVDDVHDFDMVAADGTRFAVEVVSDTSEADRFFWDQIDRMQRMPLDKEQGWHAELGTPGEHAKDLEVVQAALQGIKAELPSLLDQLDASGLCDAGKSVFVGYPRRGEHPLCTRLRELSVRTVRKSDHYVDDDGRPYVLFGRAGYGGSTGPSDLTDAANDALGKKRRRIGKARQDGPVEVHLFVWLPIGQEHADRNPGLAASEFVGPDNGVHAPELGDADKVWIAGWGFIEDRIASDMWSYSTAEGWARHAAADTPPLCDG